MHTDLHTRALHSAMNEEPHLSLNFYTYGITLRKCEGGKTTEFPIDVRRAKRPE